VSVVKVPIAPEPDVTLSVPLVRVPAPVIVPVPVAVRATEPAVPEPVLMPPVSAILELLPVSVRDTVPPEVVVRPEEPTVTVAELAESVKATDAGLLPVLESVTAVLESVTHTLPVLVRETVPAEVEMFVPEEPILPEPEVRFSVPEVVSVPTD
jgi:hypothetical protein